MTDISRRWLYLTWLAMICGFAALHLLHLSADFPNYSPWFSDWAKYTDEGWWGSAAVRAHLTGNWYLTGDYNPASAAPLWPFLEWILFFFTGVTIEAARGLAVAFFFINLILSFILLRANGPLWRALLALTLLVTSPFLYSFSRLAILEPLLIALTLAALNLAIRLPRLRHPVAASICIGILFLMMMLTKTTALFLAPALGWAMICPFGNDRKIGIRYVLAAAGVFMAGFGIWMGLVVSSGKFEDFRNIMLVNPNLRSSRLYWPLVSLYWEAIAGWQADRMLVVLSGLVLLGTVLTGRAGWGRRLLQEPLFGASALAVAGYLLFLIFYGHAAPRYFAVVTFFGIFMVVLAAHELLQGAAADGATQSGQTRRRKAGAAIVAASLLIAGFNGVWTIHYAANPEYTFVNAASQLTRFIDEHPNGNRLLVSASGDEIMLMTHLPARCDTFAVPCKMLPNSAERFAMYQPGWYAAWNHLDRNVLADIHAHFSIEQVASYSAYDDPKRNLLVLFKLHPLPAGEARESGGQNLQLPQPGDKIEIPVD